MLLGLDAMLPRRFFAEVQKPADLTAKLGEFTVRMGGETAHKYIVSRYFHEWGLMCSFRRSTANQRPYATELSDAVHRHGAGREDRIRSLRPAILRKARVG